MSRSTVSEGRLATTFPMASGVASVRRQATVPLTPGTAAQDRRSLLLMSLRDNGERAPLAQEIFDEIAVAIVEGRLLPGESLNSVELAGHFGTSRGPVREALADLERQGVVVIPPRRRPYVAPVTLKQIKDVYDLRSALCALVSELIVETAPAKEISGLWEWQDAIEDCVARNSPEDYFWLNVGFRLAEMRLSGNEYLQRTLGSIGIRILQFRHLGLSRPGRIEDSVQKHRRLLEAYESRDRLAAVQANRNLIMSAFVAIRDSGQFQD